MIFFVTLLFSLSWISRAGADCNSYIISTKTSDVVLTASSEYASSNKTYDYSASRGVINTTEFTTQNGVVYMGAWTAATDDDKQYLQIQLKKDYLITGVVTQGRNGCCQQWVTKYRVFYGDDCNHLKVLDGGKGTGFQGNSDENTMVTNKLPFPVTARCIRIAPSKWHNKVSMRVDLLGCLHQTTVSPSGNGSTTAPMTSTTMAQQTVFLPGVCSVNLLSANTTLTSHVTASNTKVNSSMLVSYLPEKAILYAQEETSMSHTRFMGGWSPQVSDMNQWIQVEFSEPAIIRGVVTQGKNGCCRKWVTKYKVSYSADCKTWNVSGGGSGQIFKANTDTDTPVPNIIICPTVVKCIRILPMEWNNEIAMRIEMIGCPIKDGGSTLSNQVTVSTTATNPMSSPLTTTTVTSLMTSGTTVPTTTSVIVNTQQTTGVNQCNTYLFSHQPYQGNITLSASSERSHFDKTNDYSANRGRLHSTETMGFGVQLHGGWSAAFKDSNQYIKVELPSIATISGIVTQGKDGSDKEWVTKYRVLYSEDCKRWNVVIGPTGSAFNGNTDTDTEVVNMFTQPIQAKCIKINPEAWNNHISLRMDLIGCFRVATQQLSVPVTQPTTTPTTTTKQTTTLQTTSIPTTTTPTISQEPLCHGSLINNATIGSLVNLTASSQFHNPASGTDPSRALLDTKTEHINAYTLLGGWSPTKDDGKQYIQATFASPHLVDSVITQGLDSTQQWVTKYKIEYSEDCVHYQQLQHPKEFTANTDYDAKVTNKLGCPVFVKCMRLYPTEWNKHSGLRFDLIGCEIIDTHSNSSVFWNTTNTVLSTTTTTSTSPSTSTATTSTSPSTSTAITSTSPSTSTTSISTTTSTSSIASTPTTTTTTTSPSTLTAQNTTTSNSQSTTTTPVMTHITHKIFPTGKASNYDKRDPLDCKRALIIDPCTDPIVKKHCFYSCNKKLGTSSSLTTSVSQASIHSNTVSMSSQNMLSASTVAISQSSLIMATTAIRHGSTNTMQSMPVISSSLSLPIQSSALSSKMSALDTSSSVVQNAQLTTMPLSSSPQFSSTSSIKASSALITQNTVTMSGAQLTTPSSSVSTSSSITVTPPVSHITHIVLPTGQAFIYNPLDPLDCKRSLLIAPCSVPIVAKHCPHSCSKPTTNAVSNSVQSSSTINPPSSNVDTSSTDRSTMSPNSVNISPSSSLSQTPGMNPGSSNIHPSHSTNLQQTSIFVHGSSNINPSPSTSLTQTTNMIPASSNIHPSPSTNVIQTTSILPGSSNTNPSFSTNLLQASSILPGSSNTNPSSSINLLQMSSILPGSSNTNPSFSINLLQASSILPGSSNTNPSFSTNLLQASSILPGSSNTNPSSSINLLQTSSILPGSSNTNPSSSINLFQTSSILPGSSNINSPPSKNVLQTSSVQGFSNINPSSSTNLLQTSSILPGISNITPSSSAHLFPTSIILPGSSNINQAPNTNLLQTSSILPGSSNIAPSSSAHLFQTSSILPGSSNINFSPSINLLQTSSDKGSSNINQASSTSMSQTSSIQPGSSNSQSLGHLINPSSAVLQGSIPSTVVSSFDIQSSGSLQGSSFAGSMAQSYGSSHSTLLAFPSQNSISSMQKFSTNVMLSSTMNPLVTISVSNSVYQSPMTSNMMTQLNSIAPRMNVASSGLSSLSKSSNPPSTTIPMSITNSILSTVPFGSSTIQVLSSNIPISSGIPSVYVSSSDNIMSSSGVFLSSSDNIMSSSGVLISSSDNIMSSSGVPMSSSDNIMSSSGVSMSSSDNIMSSSGVSMSSSDNIMSSSGAPVLFTGIPSLLPSVPMSSANNPMSSSGVPVLSSGIPSVLPSVPVSSSDNLVSSSGVLMLSNSISSVLPSVPVSSFDSLVSTGGIPMFSTVSMYSSVLPSSSISVVTVSSSNAPLSSSGVHIPSSDISSSHHAVMSSGIMMPPSSVAMSSGIPILTSHAPSSSSVQMTSGVETSSLSNSVLSTADMSSALQISPSSTSGTPNIQVTDSISSSVVSMLSSSVSMSITCAPMSSSGMTMSTSHILTPSTSIPVTIRSSALSYSSLIMTPSSYMSHYSDAMSYSGLASSYVSSVGMFVSSGVPMTCYNVPITITPVLPLSLSSMYSTATPSSSLIGSTISPVTSTILQTASTNMATMSQKVSSSSIKTTSQSPATTTPTTLTTSTTPVTTPPRPTTTVTHITHITIPTGVASIYDKRDPVDCKRSLKAFKCTVPIIAMHCPFSCKKQAGRRKRGILTGSSTRSDKKMMLFGSSFQSSKKSNSDMNII